jgi:hypothetical protein
VTHLSEIEIATGEQSLAASEQVAVTINKPHTVRLARARRTDSRLPRRLLRRKQRWPWHDQSHFMVFQSSATLDVVDHRPSVGRQLDRVVFGVVE